MLQYGVTRERLREVLEEAEGWDVIHVSGHGVPGELVLETADGGPDPITAAELVGLLGVASGRVKLVVVSVCWSAAAALAEQRRLLSLPGHARDREGGAEPGEGVNKRPAGNLAAELSARLGCAVLAMRFGVMDGFAVSLAARFYDLVAGKGQPVARALGIALGDPSVVAHPPHPNVRRCRW